MSIFLLHPSKIGALSEWNFRASKTKPPHKRRASDHLSRFIFLVVFSSETEGVRKREGRRDIPKLSHLSESQRVEQPSLPAAVEAPSWTPWPTSLRLPSFPRSPILPLVRTTHLVDNRRSRGGYGPHNQPQWESLFSSTNRAVIKFSSKKPRGEESFDQITRLDEIIKTQLHVLNLGSTRLFMKLSCHVIKVKGLGFRL
jgi:hypothetical protein